LRVTQAKLEPNLSTFRQPEVMVLSMKPRSLSEVNPDLALEAEGWDPSGVSANSRQKLVWRCSKDHLWEATVANRNAGRGCPICAGNVVLPGFNDLATTNPLLAAQANGWDPTAVSAGSGKSFSWKCPEGHVFEMVVGTRSRRGLSCPVCSGHHVQSGVNDLATRRPEIASQAHHWDPTTASEGSNKKVEWICSEGHIWSSPIVSRTKQGTGCPVCSNKVVLIGTNDMATTHPTLAEEADGWDPTSIVAGTSKRLLWKCKLGHSWTQTGNARVGLNLGCPVCGGTQLLRGFNDLATLFPDLALEADGWDPTKVKVGQNIKRKWKCKLGHNWKALDYPRTKGVGCPVCSGQQLLAGFNDMATTHPELAVEAVGWNPTKYMAGTGTKLKWRCPSGHEYFCSGANRLAGTGCPTCAKFGYDPSSPGWLYLLEHDEWGMQQIGITNVPETRMHQHERIGWQKLDIRGPMDGSLCRDWESSILKLLEKKLEGIDRMSEGGRFSGFTEAWPTSAIKVADIESLLNMVHQAEEQGDT
jgi:Probable Zinc-ribbon domain